MSVSRGGAGQAVGAPRAEFHVAGVGERAELQEDAVAVLQRGDDRTCVAAAEEMAFERVERRLEVAAEKGLGGFEEIALGDVGRELGDVRFLDGAAFGNRVGQLVHFLDEQARVGADFLDEEARGVGREFHAEGAGFGEGDAGERVGVAIGIAADEDEVGVFLAPLGKRAAAVDGRGGDEDGGFVGVEFFEQRLKIGDERERALGATGDGVGEEVDVLEPHDAFAAEHGDGLHGVAEAQHGGFDFADVVGETAEHVAREIVGAALGDERGEAFAAEAVDEEIVGSADEGEVFRGGAHSRRSEV